MNILRFKNVIEEKILITANPLTAPLLYKQDDDGDLYKLTYFSEESHKMSPIIISIIL